MNTKTKITLGIGTLSVLIASLLLLSTRQIFLLEEDTRNILAANYHTLEYTREMLLALEQLPGAAAAARFGQNLRHQQANITEPGEQALTDSLASQYETLRAQAPRDSAREAATRFLLLEIMHLNMAAILRKSQAAEAYARQARLSIALTGGACLLIALVLLANLPGSIARPLRSLSESIRDIAAQNYARRVHIESKDEFGELARAFNAMAAKLEAYNSSSLASLMNEKKRIEALVNTMKDPVIGLDEQHRIIFANQEALAVTGLAAEELIGKPAQELVLRNDLIRALIHELLAPPAKPIGSEPIAIYVNRKESYFEKELLHITAQPEGRENPQVIGHVIFLRNVTAYHEQDMAKTRFIATVSHEFKTPLAAIQMSLQLLENEKTGPLNADQQELIGSIREDTKRLLGFTRELLDITQAESGQIRLALRPADLREIAAYAVRAIGIQAAQKQVQIEVQAQPNLPEVMADSDKAAWVLVNLLSNAVRYSRTGSRVQLRMQTGKDSVELWVEDQGPGILPQFQQRIFERYFRVPGLQQEGTGLGLAISKEFMEAQGGSIRLQSEMGVGSTFILSFAPAQQVQRA